MTAPVAGIYAAYLSGKTGHGFAMLLFSNGRVAGADAFGVKFDGSYAELASGNVAIEMDVDSPPNTQLLQGGFTGEDGDVYTLKLDLPSDFSTTDYVPIDTKHGRINARIRKIRELSE